MNVALPSTKGGGLLCVTNERWGSTRRTTAIACSISFHERPGCSEGCKQAHAIIVYRCRGFANEVSVGLVTLFTPYHRLGNTLWREFELDIGRKFWSFWSFLTPLLGH